MNKFFKLLTMLTAAVVCVVSVSVEAFAADKSIELIGKIYVDEDADSYSISSDKYLGTSSDNKTMGKVTVNGDYTVIAKKNDVDAYLVTDDKNITINYSFDKSYVTDDDYEWHITDDGSDIIDGIELENDIDSGAVILLTSLDHEHWYLNNEYTDIIDSMDSDNASKVFKTNNYALSNGCYYRIVAAYYLKKKNSGWGAFSDWDSKTVTEVYEFYAKYKCADEKPVSENDKNEYLGEVVNAGDDEGFSVRNSITIDDPHYGW